MLRRLNTYFLAKGRLLSEREYKEALDAPFRLIVIEKYIGRWPRVLSFLTYYYPQWKDKAVVEPVEEETAQEAPKKSGLEALKAKKDESSE